MGLDYSKDVTAKIVEQSEKVKPEIRKRAESYVSELKASKRKFIELDEKAKFTERQLKTYDERHKRVRKEAQKPPSLYQMYLQSKKEETKKYKPYDIKVARAESAKMYKEHIAKQAAAQADLKDKIEKRTAKEIAAIDDEKEIKEFCYINGYHTGKEQTVALRGFTSGLFGANMGSQLNCAMRKSGDIWNKGFIDGLEGEIFNVGKAVIEHTKAQTSFRDDCVTTTVCNTSGKCKTTTVCTPSDRDCSTKGVCRQEPCHDEPCDSSGGTCSGGDYGTCAAEPFSG